MKNSTILVYLTLIMALLFYSCSKEENPIKNTETLKTITINHTGIDWSTGETGESGNITNSDGETIAWCEYGTTNTFWGQLIMYRPMSGKMFKLTTTDLTQVASIDTTKFQTSFDCGEVKLKPNDIWISQCADGYVAFKVLEAPQDSASIAADHMWKVKVQYKYSTTINF